MLHLVEESRGRVADLRVLRRARTTLPITWQPGAPSIEITAMGRGPSSSAPGAPDVTSTTLSTRPVPHAAELELSPAGITEIVRGAGVAAGLAELDWIVPAVK